MKRFLPPFIDGTPAVGLLILRLVAGAAMSLHGAPKIKQPFGWMGAESHVPGFLQALAAVSEFGGGLALLVGLLTPLACLAIMSTMFVATWSTIKSGGVFVSNTGAKSYELPLLYFVVALLILLCGPGKLSLDALMFGAKKNRFGRR